MANLLMVTAQEDNRYELFEEANALLRNTLQLARRSLGRDHLLVMRIAMTLGSNLLLTADAFGMYPTVLDEVELIYANAVKTARRVLGASHPNTKEIQVKLDVVRGLQRGESRYIAAEAVPKGPYDAPD